MPSPTGRPPVKKIVKCFLNAEVFFLTDEQQHIVHQAMEAIGVPYGQISKAERRSIALTCICAGHIHAQEIRQQLNKIKSSADNKQKPPGKTATPDIQ